jgi:hypothetical protein
LSLLNSESSPIEKCALIVKVNPVDGFVQPPKHNVASVLMASWHTEALYLEYTASWWFCCKSWPASEE